MHARRSALVPFFLRLACSIGLLGLLVSASFGEDAIGKDAIAADPAKLVDQLNARLAYVLNPPPAVKTLEYEFDLSGEISRLKLARGERHPYAVWMGATLHSGLHQLLRNQDKFSVTVENNEAKQELTLHATLKEPGSFVFHVGNGIQGSWRGYYSHGAREISITLDAKRLVPLRETTGASTVLYSDWREADPGHWVPLRIDVQNDDTHYRMHFDWWNKSIWLLEHSESISPDATRTVSRVASVRVNDGATIEAKAAQAARKDAARKVVRDLLDHNRPWLDPGETGAGWKPPFNHLSYGFLAEREEIGEKCMLAANGEAAFEVSRDGQQKMKDKLGARRVVLDSKEYADIAPGANFARIKGRPERERELPYDIALKQCARIGCQFDLPLFRLNEFLDTVNVEVAETLWKDVPCRKVTITDIGRRAFLGCGTMFAFSSWSYAHHLYPDSEVFYILPGRNLLLHETLTSGERTFEIDYSDYIELEPGQFAPLAIRIESKDYFTCEYRFQIVGKSHWMLKEVVSWFDPASKSRGLIQDVQIDKNRALLDDALALVKCTRKIFAGEGEPEEALKVACAPFALGETMKIGGYDIHVTLHDLRTVVVNVSTADAAAPATASVCFFDEKGRLLFAPSIALAEKEGRREGWTQIRGSHIWGDVRFVAAPGMKPQDQTIAAKVVPFRWNEPIAINVPDSKQGKPADNEGYEKPYDAMTRAIRVRVDRNEDGTARAKLDIASIDGMHEFYFDVAVALLGDSGELIASGHKSELLKVVSDVVEKQYEIDLGALPDGIEPKHVVIGLSPGNVTSAPMGSFWGTFFLTAPPLPVADILSSPDESCWRVGLESLGKNDLKKSIKDEFFDERPHDFRVGDGEYSRRTLLKPHRENFRRIVQDAKTPEVLTETARLLAWSDDEETVKLLEPLLSHESVEVREAAMVGQTFAGDTRHIDEVRRRILSIESEHREYENQAWLTFDRREESALVALSHNDSDAAVDALGAILLEDIKSLRIARSEKQKEYVTGRNYRVTRICGLLGRTNRPRAAHWLLSAADLLAERKEIQKLYSPGDIIAAMVHFEEQTRDRIAREIASGKKPDSWAWAIRQTRNPFFVPAVRELLRRDDMTASGMNAAIDYLVNLESSEALPALQECFDRKRHRENTQLWLTLGWALAFKGDGRGLPEAFDVMVAMEAPAAPPSDAKERKEWTNARDKLRRRAADVASRVPRDALESFLASRATNPSAHERRVLLELLWRLPTVPEQFSPLLTQWSSDPDEKFATSAKRLLERG